MKFHLDEDLEEIIIRIAKENKVSSTQAVNSILRSALGEDDDEPEEEEEEE